MEIINREDHENRELKSPLKLQKEINREDHGNRELKSPLKLWKQLTAKTTETAN